MHAANVSGLKNNPSETLRNARDDVVVVMNRDHPDPLMIGLQSGKLLSEPGARGIGYGALSRWTTVAGSKRPHGPNAMGNVHHACLTLGIAVVAHDAGEVARDMETLDQWLAMS